MKKHKSIADYRHEMHKHFVVEQIDIVTHVKIKRKRKKGQSRVTRVKKTQRGTSTCTRKKFFIFALEGMQTKKDKSENEKHRDERAKKKK